MATKPTVSISEIEFSGGQKFTFSPNEKIMLVGSNNSGKSQTLREIMQISINGENASRVVLKNVSFEKKGNSEDLRKFLDENADFMAPTITIKVGPYRNMLSIIGPHKNISRTDLPMAL